jgi:hypothetical protein
MDVQLKARPFLWFAFSPFSVTRKKQSAAGQGRMNPHFRIGADRGRQSAKLARVFAVDENVHVAAKLALFV